MDNRAMYEALSIKGEVYDFCEKELDGLSDRFREIDEIADFNQLKVIKAMQDAKLSEAHLYGTTGYGYDDIGRDTLEKTYANVFGTEDALVRSQIICGTHALSTALLEIRDREMKFFVRLVSHMIHWKRSSAFVPHLDHLPNMV